MPSNTEIKEYVDNVIDTYNLRRAMTFGTEVVRSVWREDANRWILYLRELETGRQYTHECQILFAATGQLVEPRPCDIPGATDFGGSIFHSARWDHSVDLEGKNVVVIGNGCMQLLSFSPRFQRVSLTFFRYCCTDRPSSSQRGKDQIPHADCPNEALDIPSPKLLLSSASAMDLPLLSFCHEAAPISHLRDC